MELRLHRAKLLLLLLVAMNTNGAFLSRKAPKGTAVAYACAGSTRHSRDRRPTYLPLFPVIITNYEKVHPVITHTSGEKV